MYNVYRIKKPRGGFRTITEPSPNLKRVLLDLKILLDAVPLHPAAHGFVSGKSPKTNAEVHRCQDYILNIDLKDFFPSIKSDLMMRELRRASLNLCFSEYLFFWIYHLCFFQGRLPQGAPTSPVLSNIYMIELDAYFMDKAETVGWRYTRYADDITFSGDESLRQNKEILLNDVKEMLLTKGLRVNPKKIKLTSKSQCQRVTGIVVNNEKLTLRGRDRENLFQSLKGTSMQNLSASDLGYLEYVRSVDAKFYEKLCNNMNP